MRRFFMSWEQPTGETSLKWGETCVGGVERASVNRRTTQWSPAAGLSVLFKQWNVGGTRSSDCLQLLPGGKPLFKI